MQGKNTHEASKSTKRERPTNERGGHLTANLVAGFWIHALLRSELDKHAWLNMPAGEKEGMFAR